jgi:hypothetical protein
MPEHGTSALHVDGTRDRHGSLRGVVLAFLAAFSVVFALQIGADESRAYTWEWTGQPYHRDPDSNWSYRDMKFSFVQDSANKTLVYNVYSYVNIACECGYHYTTVNVQINGTTGGPTYDVRALYLDKDNTPRWYLSEISMSAPGSQVYVRSSHCADSQDCGFYFLWTYGAYLEARVPLGGSTAYCNSRGLPTYTGSCW